MQALSTDTSTHIDPVCSMGVDPGRTRLVAIYQGHSYWFCSEDCRKAFEMNPQKYLESRPPKRKGWFGRCLDRMAKTNEEQFGSSGPKCH